MNVGFAFPHLQMQQGNWILSEPSRLSTAISISDPNSSTVYTPHVVLKVVSKMVIVVNLNGAASSGQPKRPENQGIEWPP